MMTLKGFTSEAHDDMAKKAAGSFREAIESSKIVSRQLESESTDLKSVHASPFDMEFFGNDKPYDLRIEFHYPKVVVDGDNLFTIRILTRLSKLDGVTAVRIALHTLESLETGSTSLNEAWVSNVNRPSSPNPLVLVRQLYWIMRDLVGSALGFGKAAPDQPAGIPNTYRQVLDYYASKDEVPAATYKTWCTGTDNKFKPFIRSVEEWRQKLGLRAAFVLSNYSPIVAPGVVERATDIFDREMRLKGIFAPPGPPPIPHKTDNNALMSRLVFINNYGRHTHKFESTATSFVWDWMHLADVIYGAGCISINGQFLAWQRGTKESIESSSGLFEGMGQVQYGIAQNLTFKP